MRPGFRLRTKPKRNRGPHPKESNSAADEGFVPRGQKPLCLRLNRLRSKLPGLVPAQRATAWVTFHLERGKLWICERIPKRC
jgi:hypothetical protein